MELGPIQKQWVADLRAHGARQGVGVLGQKNAEGNWSRMCCLGQLHLTACEMNGGEVALTPKDFMHTLSPTGKRDIGELHNYKDYGLRSSLGVLEKSVKSGDIEYFEEGTLGYWTSLAEFNDEGVSWANIARYIEEHPDNVFTEPK